MFQICWLAVSSFRGPSGLLYDPKPVSCPRTLEVYDLILFSVHTALGVPAQDILSIVGSETSAHYYCENPCGTLCLAEPPYYKLFNIVVLSRYSPLPLSHISFSTLIIPSEQFTAFPCVMRERQVRHFAFRPCFCRIDHQLGSWGAEP